MNVNNSGAHLASNTGAPSNETEQREASASGNTPAHPIIHGVPAHPMIHGAQAHPGIHGAQAHPESQMASTNASVNQYNLPQTVLLTNEASNLANHLINTPTSRSHSEIESKINTAKEATQITADGDPNSDYDSEDSSNEAPEFINIVEYAKMRIAGPNHSSLSIETSYNSGSGMFNPETLTMEVSLREGSAQDTLYASDAYIAQMQMWCEQNEEPFHMPQRIVRNSVSDDASVNIINQIYENRAGESATHNVKLFLNDSAQANDAMKILAETVNGKSTLAMIRDYNAITGGTVTIESVEISSFLTEEHEDDGNIERERVPSLHINLARTT